MADDEFFMVDLDFTRAWDGSFYSFTARSEEEVEQEVDYAVSRGFILAKRTEV